MTVECTSSTKLEATSPAANTFANPVTRMNWSAVTRPNRSSGPGNVATTGLARMPARHTVGGGKRATQLARHLGRHFDAGKARPHHHDRRAPRRVWLHAERRDMRIEPNRRRIGVDIKAFAREPGNVRAHQFAAERQHESIV